jgi:adenylate cyclase
MATYSEVRFHPSGRAVRVAPGTSLMEAARQGGLPLGSSCDGEGACGWCRVTVVEGSESLSPAGARERSLLEKIDAGPGERIACQARVLVLGPVTITTGYW